MNPDDLKDGGQNVAILADQVLLHLPGLTAQFISSTITIGDLFACEDKLVYIPLSSTSYYGKLAGIGFLIGGLIGAIATTISDSQNLEYAQTMAKVARQSEYGTSLVERVEKHKGVIIKKGDIDAIEMLDDSQGIRVVHKGGQLLLGADKASECCQQLNDWLAGKLQGHGDVQGTNLALPAAATLIQWFARNEIAKNLSVQAHASVLSEPDYLIGFLHEFDLKQYSVKVAVINTARGFSDRWMIIFRDHLEEVRPKAKQKVWWGGVVAATGILSVCYYFLSPVAHRPSANMLVFGFLLAVFSIPVLLMLVSNYRRIGKLIQMTNKADR